MFFGAKKTETIKVDNTSIKDLELVTKMSQEFAKTLDLKETLQTSLELIIKRINAQAANIFLIDDDKQNFQCIASKHQAYLEDFEIPITQGVMGKAALMKECIRVGDVRKDKRIKMTSEEESLFGIDKLNIKRSSIPAVTHVDYSARIQTVHKQTNPKYHALISKFKEKTGFSVVVNTSFNVRGEPIVCSPQDAFRCFMGTELDVLVIGNCVLRKEQQDKSLTEDYKDKYELD